MTPDEKLKGLKTSLKVTLSVVERLEAHNTEFQVGVRCLSAEKADYVAMMLETLLHGLKDDFELSLSKNENQIEVRRKLENKLTVLPPLVEEFDTDKLPVLPDSPKSGDSATSSSD